MISTWRESCFSTDELEAKHALNFPRLKVGMKPYACDVGICMPSFPSARRWCPEADSIYCSASGLWGRAWPGCLLLGPGGDGSNCLTPAWPQTYSQLFVDGESQNVQFRGLATLQ